MFEMADFSPSIVALVFASAFLGLWLGCAAANMRLRRALTVAASLTKRITRKKIARIFGSAVDPNKVGLDNHFGSLSDAEKTNLADQMAVELVTQFREYLGCHYHDEIAAIYLYGSRARGDHGLNSDINVAVFVDATKDSMDSIRKRAIWFSCKLLLQDGVYLQPRVYSQSNVEKLKGQIEDLPIEVQTILRCGVAI